MPSYRDLPDSGIKPVSHVSCMAGEFFIFSATWEALISFIEHFNLQFVILLFNCFVSFFPTGPGDNINLSSFHNFPSCLWRGIIQARLKQRGVDIISSAICVPIQGGCEEWCWCLVGEGGSEDGGGRPVTAPCPHPSEKGNVERLLWLGSFPPAPSPKYLYKQSCFLSLPKMPGALVS